MLSFFMPSRSMTVTKAPWDDFWYGIVGHKTAAGPHINETSAMQYSPYWAAERAIAGTMGRLRFELQRKLDRGREVVAGDRRAFIWNHRANPYTNAFTLRSFLSSQQISEGNAFAEIERSSRGELVALWPIHASRVVPKMDPETGRNYYGIRMNDGKPDQTLWPEEMLHIPNWKTKVIADCDFLWGIGVREMARENLGIGLAAERNRGLQFGANNVPAIVVETPRKMMPDDRAAFRREWKEVHSEGGGAVALLTEGATAKPLNLNNRDMQHQELSYFGIEDVSRWTGVPVHMLAHLLKSSQNNIEHLSTEFVQYCLQIYMEPWEQECEAKLLTEAEQADHEWEFLVRDLLRGDMAAQEQFHGRMVQIGVETRNEAREAFGMNPIEGGDEPLVQGAMIPADMAGQNNQPSKPTPPGDEQASKIDATREEWIRSVATRVAKIEATGVKRSAGDPSTFKDKCGKFYETFAGILEKEFAECWEQSTAFVQEWLRQSAEGADALLDYKTAEFTAAAESYADKLVIGRPVAAVKAWRESHES